ncbi:hypothetical protein GGI17_005715 [Coemansia sp. S146]|nr:hypothetical protein GGI17_005715 [Coemansia sp. S146]
MGKIKRHSGHSASHPSRPSNVRSTTVASTPAAPVLARASAKDKGKAPDISNVDPLDEPLDSVEAEIVTAAAKGARATHGIVKAKGDSPPGLNKPATIDGRWWKQYFSTRPTYLRPLVVDPEIFDEIDRIVKYMGPLRTDSIDFLSFHLKPCIEAYGELPIINMTMVRHAMYFIRDRGKCKYGETDSIWDSYNEYTGAYRETGYNGQPPSDDALASIINYVAKECIKNIHKSVDDNLPLTVYHIMELKLTAAIRAEGKEFPQPKASQRTNKRMKQWRKSKHRKVRTVAVAVANATPQNARATPIIDTCFAADIDDCSDADSDGCSDAGDSWSDGGDAWSDCDVYTDSGDTYADADAGDEKVGSAATVVVVDRKKTHKRGKNKNLTRMARIRRKKNKRENKEKLERRLAPTKRMSIYEKKGRMLSKALMFMYQQNVKLDSLGGKQVALIPLFAVEASYITIDSKGLYDIICSVAKKHKDFVRPETSYDNGFKHSRLFYWAYYFCLAQEYMRRHGVDAVGNTKYFNLMLTTDGVGVSIGLTWWRSFPNGKCKQDDDSEHDTRKAASESNIDSIKGFRSWMSEIPDSRTSTAEKAHERLKYLYGSKFHCDLLEIRMSFATSKSRWDFFRRKRRAIVQACQYWTHGLDKDKTTICIGDAKFTTSRHGFRATPSICKFGRYLQEAGWHVMYIWEFNTSRVCSNCHLDLAHDKFPNAMCGLGEAADNFAYCHKAKSKFTARHCTNPACICPWDRDRNATRNIVYLGVLRYFQRERPL